MNEQNLVQNRTDITAEQRSAAASKAGKESGRKRRERRNMRETAELMLSGQMPLWSYQELEKYSIPGLRKTSTVQDALIAHMILIAAGHDIDAKTGDRIRATEFLRDTVGDKNPEKIEVGTGEQLQLNLTVIGDDPAGGEAV